MSRDNNEVVIKVSHVSKSFKLPYEKNTSIKSIVVNPFRKRSFEKQVVLKDINFEINKGEFLGIVGRNGSGKSTLLKLIAGIYSPDKGHIEINGKLTPFIELGVGFNPELTGRENVFLNGALLGFSRKQMNAMYDEIVEFAELEKFMGQKLKNYSSGMQVRLAFSVAICAKSEILLLDEVLAVGDASFQRKCFNYFKELKKTKQTVILVTHDMDVVREFCDRGLLISSGSLVFSGTPVEVAREYLKEFASSEPLLVAENIEKKETGSRWGTGKTKYSSVKLMSIDNGYKLSLTAVANETIENPIYGFSVKSPDGKSILGTNSHIKGSKKTKVEDGEKTKITWEFPNIFSNGIHSIDIAITQNDGATVHDWWDSALQFEVTGKDKTPYVISPPVSLKLS